MPSATLKIFLVFGDPKRLRTAELSNWTGKAVAGPRSEIEKIFTVILYNGEIWEFTNDVIRVTNNITMGRKN